MDYNIKTKFSPVSLEIEFHSGRELANFCRAVRNLAVEYKADYDQETFVELSEELDQTMKEKIDCGEMANVE
jgi:hypothetical protein